MSFNIVCLCAILYAAFSVPLIKAMDQPTASLQTSQTNSTASMLANARASLQDMTIVLGWTVAVGGIGYWWYRRFQVNLGHVEQEEVAVHQTTQQVQKEVAALSESQKGLHTKVDVVKATQKEHGDNLKDLKRTTAHIQQVTDSHTPMLQQLKSTADDTQARVKKLEESLAAVNARTTSMDTRLESVEKTADEIRAGTGRIQSHLKESDRLAQERHAQVLGRVDEIKRKLESGVTVAGVNPSLRASLRQFTQGSSAQEGPKPQFIKPNLFNTVES